MKGNKSKLTYFLNILDEDSDISVKYMDIFSVMEVNDMQVVNLLDEMERRGIIDSTVRKALEDKKTRKEDASVKPSSNDDNSGVTLEISDEAKKKYIELLNLSKHMAEIQEQNEASKENGNQMGKIFTIFRRIANGDRVPPKDEEKLREYSSELYQAAKTLGSLAKNKEPKDYDSVDEEDEKSDMQKEVARMIGEFDKGTSASLERTIAADITMPTIESE